MDRNGACWRVHRVAIPPHRYSALKTGAGVKRRKRRGAQKHRDGMGLRENKAQPAYSPDRGISRTPLAAPCQASRAHAARSANCHSNNPAMPSMAPGRHRADQARRRAARSRAPGMDQPPTSTPDRRRAPRALAVLPGPAAGAATETVGTFSTTFAVGAILRRISSGSPTSPTPNACAALLPYLPRSQNTASTAQRRGLVSVTRAGDSPGRRHPGSRALRRRLPPARPRQARLEPRRAAAAGQNHGRQTRRGQWRPPCTAAQQQHRQRQGDGATATTGR